MQSMLKEFIKMGFEIEENYALDGKIRLVAKFNNKPCIILCATSEVGEKKIRNRELFDEYVRFYIESINWTTPKTLGNGRVGDSAYWYAQERFTGKALGRQETLTVVDDFLKYIPRITSLLKRLDEVPHDAILPSDDITDPSLYTSGRIDVLRKTVEPLIHKSLLRKSEVDSCIEVLNLTKDTIEFRMQHHDVLPWHIFELEGDMLGIIDSEYGGWRVRFYDIAYTFTKLMSSIKRNDLAHLFLEEVLKQFKGANLEKGLIFPLAFTVPREMTERAEANDLEALEIMQKMIEAIAKRDLSLLPH